MGDICFSFEKKNYNDGFFNKSIDATYIIHLEGNGRLKSINNQLDNYHPTNLVYIVFNKGYKKCKKEVYINEPAKDLMNAYLTIFKHAKEQKYNNILILEDDFLFSPKIKDNVHIENINIFLSSHINSNIQYYLGTIPWLRVPYIHDNNHYIGLITTGSHSVVYTKSNREKILQVSEQKLMSWDWDVYNLIYSRSYMYYIPLCYQLFYETDNRKKWGNQNIFTRLLGISITYIFDFLNMDKHVEPGYSYFYNFSIIIFYIILCLILVIAIYIGMFLYKIYTNTHINLYSIGLKSSRIGIKKIKNKLRSIFT
jgi:hypothetical protein